MAEEKSSPLGFLFDNAVFASLRDTYTSFSERRKALGLSNPGSADSVSREVQRDVLCTHYLFSGFRAESQKLFSVAPLFRIQHGMALGSPSLPPYQLMAVYGTNGTPAAFLQAGLSNTGSLSIWGHYRMHPRLVTKAQGQLEPGNPDFMLQLDNEYNGDDFSASLKAISPSLLQGSFTGVLQGSYMQSLTPSLSLGLEGTYIRQAPNVRPETMINYSARYKGGDWIASAQLSPQGKLEGSYWKRLSDKVQAGVDLSLAIAPEAGGGGMYGRMQREGATTVGVKYDFTASTFRAQFDSKGKVAAFLEKRVTPIVAVTFAGEIDQPKQQTKIGLAVSIESAPEEVMNGSIQPSDELPPPV